MGANGTESTNQLARTIERARLAQDPYVEGLTLKDQTLEEGLDLTFFEFHALELEASSLTSLKCKKASFYDCTLTNCDLAGSDFTSAYFSRCRFIDCKLEGAILTEAILRTSRLIGCQCRYLNAGEASFENVRFEDTDLSEAFLSEVKLKRSCKFSGCKLVHADLFRTNLRGIDLSTTDIQAIQTSEDRHELRGAIISLAQAPEVAMMLGVVIEGIE